MLKAVESGLYYAIDWIILLIEAMGVGILTFTMVKGFFALFTERINTKLVLAEGFSLSLGFLLGSEILRTVVTHSLGDILLVGGLVALRVALTVLLHWEMKNERMEQEEKLAEKK